MTRSEKLSYQLAQACLGRENHADLFFLRAVRLPQGRTRLEWIDRFLHQHGPLATIDPFEVDPVVRKLFTQLRTWRERCENRPAEKTKGAAA